MSAIAVEIRVAIVISLFVSISHSIVFCIVLNLCESKVFVYWPLNRMPPEYGRPALVAVANCTPLLRPD